MAALVRRVLMAPLVLSFTVLSPMKPWLPMVRISEILVRTGESHYFEAITQHNLVFQARLVGQARDAIMEDRYPQYLKNFFQEYFGTIGYPRWCIEALRTVGVDLLEDVSTSQAQINIVEGDGAKWEYSEANIR
nr:hypothetical protein FRC18_004115 [Serendipita sp. 400]KAG9055524.1 hypothetical protein FS842_001960 [Serendipita sp. 407]